MNDLWSGCGGGWGWQNVDQVKFMHDVWPTNLNMIPVSQNRLMVIYADD